MNPNYLRRIVAITLIGWAFEFVTSWLQFHRMPHWITLAATIVVAAILAPIIVRWEMRRSSRQVMPINLPQSTEDVQTLMRQGKKIEAIKVYRKQTGLGLKEAKDAVEEMERSD